MSISSNIPKTYVQRIHRPFHLIVYKLCPGSLAGIVRRRRELSLMDAAQRVTVTKH